MPPNRIRRALLLALLVLTPLMASCHKSSTKNAPSTGELPAARVTITFGCFDSQKRYYEGLIEPFESANPGVHVQLVSIDQVLGSLPASGPLPEDTPRRLVAAADTLAMWLGPEMTRQGLVSDLSPFIQADRSFDPEDFYPYTLESLQWEDGTWGLPSAAEAFHLIFYDKEAFDAAGVPYPQPGWTWKDFLSKAKALTEWAGDEIVRWGFVEHRWNPTPFVQGRVGALVDSSTDPPTPLLERPAVVEAVRWYTDLALVHRVMPAPTLDERASAQATLWVTKRQAAMWSDSSTSWEQWSAGQKLGVVPFPVDDATSATTPVRMNSLVMSAGTAHPEENWRWLAFLSRQPPEGGDMPARRSVAENSGYWETLGEEQAAAYRYALEHGLSRTEHSTWLEGALHDALESILTGEKDVKEALAEAQAQVQANVGAEMTREEGGPAAVATPRPAQPVESAGQKIVFIVPFSKELSIAYKALTDEFHRTHPGITVESLGPSSVIPEGGSVYFEDLLPLIAEKTDCFVLLWRAWPREEMVNLLPLDPLLEADAFFPVDDFYPVVMDALRVDGQLRALPMAVHPRMMFYDKTAFDDAALAYPSPGWTLDDFLALAIALTEGEGSNKRYGYLPRPDFGDVLFFTEQYGARWIDTSTQPVTYLFDAPATVQAVQWYTDLSLVHGVMPEPRPSRSASDWRTLGQEWQAMVQSGRAAMWSGYPIFMPPARSYTETVEIGTAPMPLGPGRIIADFMPTVYAISSQTEHPQACWQWIKFLTEQPSLFSDAQIGFAPRRSVAKSAAYRQRMGEAVAAAYEAAIEQGDHLASLARWPPPPGADLGRWVVPIVQATMAGENAELLLSEAQDQAEAYLACLETKQGLEGEELVQACLQEIDLSFLPDE